MKLTKLIISILLCLSIGFTGSYFTSDSISSWYDTLNKPTFTPPNWTFGVVWTILYILMGVSAFLVWNQGFKKKSVKIALALFVFQLILNGLWTPIFFGLHYLGIALIDIVMMWIVILLTIIYFHKVSKLASLLLVPYLIWVSYATALNTGFWWLNK